MFFEFSINGLVQIRFGTVVDIVISASNKQLSNDLIQKVAVNNLMEIYNIAEEFSGRPFPVNASNPNNQLENTVITMMAVIFESQESLNYFLKKAQKHLQTN